MARSGGAARKEAEGWMKLRSVERWVSKAEFIEQEFFVDILCS